MLVFEWVRNTLTIFQLLFFSSGCDWALLSNIEYVFSYALILCQNLSVSDSNFHKYSKTYGTAIGIGIYLKHLFQISRNNVTFVHTNHVSYLMNINL